MPDQKFIDQPSTPLKAVGDGPPKFVDIEEKCNATEDEVGYVSFTVEGNPPPQFKFAKGTFDIPDTGRYAYLTDGKSNEIHLGIRKIKPNDEGVYTCILKNPHGEIKQDIELFVSPKGGMDMRQMLKKKKKPETPKPKEEDSKPDEFEKALVDKSCEEGVDLELLFEAVFSKPNCTPKWTFKDQVVEEDARHIMAIDNNTYTLKIMSPVPADMGKYILEINGLTTEAFITVKGKPQPEEAPSEFSFLKSLQSKYTGYKGRSLLIEAQVPPGPFEVHWFKSNNEIKGDGAKYEMSHDPETGHCSLLIKSCDENDADMYSVRVDPGNHTSEAQVAVEDVPVKFGKGLKSPIRATEGDIVQLEVELSEEDGEVTWRDGSGRAFDVNDPRLTFLVDGLKRSLIFQGVEVPDAGLITCTTNADETRTELIVDDGVKFVKNLNSSISGIERDTVDFEVIAEGAITSAEWFRNGKKIDASDRYEINNWFDEGIFQLRIHNLALKDAGKIHCQLGRLTSEVAKFTVEKGESSPKIDLADGTSIELNLTQKPVKFSVPYQIEGTRQSPVEAQVFKDDKPVNFWDIYVVQDEVILDLRAKPTRQMSGKYQIKIWNDQGEDERRFTLNLLNVPTSPENVEVSEVNENSCFVTWKPPADDGGAPIQYYIIERTEVTGGRCLGEWVPIKQISACSTSFPVEDLEPGKEYKFRVKAENLIGQSDPGLNNMTILAKNPFGNRGNSAPCFLIKPSNQLAFQGQKVVISCRIGGSPAPFVSWYFRGCELPHSMKFMKKGRGGDYIFVIYKVQLEDRGEYRVTASNYLGFTSAIFHLVVEQGKFPDGEGFPFLLEPAIKDYRTQWNCNYKGLNVPRLMVDSEDEKDCRPTFTFPLRNRSLQAGQTSCKLVCCIRGKPTPQIKWFKGSESLNPSYYNFKRADCVISVELQDLKPGDSGIYRCEVANYLGTESSECFVSVE